MRFCRRCLNGLTKGGVCIGARTWCSVSPRAHALAHVGWWESTRKTRYAPTNPRRGNGSPTSSLLLLLLLLMLCACTRVAAACAGRSFGLRARGEIKGTPCRRSHRRLVSGARTHTHKPTRNTVQACLNTIILSYGCAACVECRTRTGRIGTISDLFFWFPIYVVTSGNYVKNCFTQASEKNRLL